MKIEKIDLISAYDLPDCELTAFLHEGCDELPAFDRPCLLVVGGGGYSMVSDREGEPVAVEFYNRGYNTFNLKYSVDPVRYPAQLLQAAATIDYIKKHAAELGANINKIFAIGFSAGGHIVGSLAAADCSGLTDAYDCSLAGIVLGYPVINYNAGHVWSYEKLLGDNPEKLLEDSRYAWLNLDESVTVKNPPAFIFSTSNDTCVSPINSILYAGSYASLNLKFELHIFKDGNHGLSLADERVFATKTEVSSEIKMWVDLADKFLKSI